MCDHVLWSVGGGWGIHVTMLLCGLCGWGTGGALDRDGLHLHFDVYSGFKFSGKSHSTLLHADE